MRFKTIAAHRDEYPTAMMCRMLRVSTSGFYAWSSRPPSRRTRDDNVIKLKLREAHRRSDGTYGSPRLVLDLVDEGFEVGRKRVRRLMREEGIVGVHRRRTRFGLTKQNKTHEPAPDLVARDFSAKRPNEKWVADITYIATDEGWLYLAVILDLFSRRIVGWSMAETMEAEIVKDALAMALSQRNPSNLVHHSDRGSQYTSATFRAALHKAGVRCSMGSVGSCYDNAAAESFFATLKTECIYRTDLPTRAKARQVVFKYIETFYNRTRRHSAIGQVAPAVFERMNQAKMAA